MKMKDFSIHNNILKMLDNYYQKYEICQFYTFFKNCYWHDYQNETKPVIIHVHVPGKVKRNDNH